MMITDISCLDNPNYRMAETQISCEDLGVNHVDLCSSNTEVRQQCCNICRALIRDTSIRDRGNVAPTPGTADNTNEGEESDSSRDSQEHITNYTTNVNIDTAKMNTPEVTSTHTASTTRIPIMTAAGVVATTPDRSVEAETTKPVANDSNTAPAAGSQAATTNAEAKTQIIYTEPFIKPTSAPGSVSVDNVLFTTKATGLTENFPTQTDNSNLDKHPEVKSDSDDQEKQHLPDFLHNLPHDIKVLQHKNQLEGHNTTVSKYKDDILNESAKVQCSLLMFALCAFSVVLFNSADC